ncbi:MAG: fused MFS/spermidine synthase, partial [Verrucomicrobiota bacterium]
HPARIAGEPVKAGIIGLGVGSLAVHAKKNDTFRFYEINPEVENLAREHFTFLEDCRGKETVIIGDARTSLENELRNGENQAFDLLFVDAFSGDSIPIHLVTEESFQLYFDHIKDDGALVVHITNLHIDLSDPVRRLAEKFGYEAMLITDDPDWDSHLMFSEWVVVTKNPEIIKNLEDGNHINEWYREEPKPIDWTDDYSNLLQVLMWD